MATILFYLLLALISFLNNLPEGYIFFAGDFGQTVNFERIVRSLSYSWASFDLGSYNLLNSSLPFYAFFGLIQKIVGLKYIFSFYMLFYLWGSFWSFKNSVRIMGLQKSDLQSNFLAFLYAVNVFTFTRIMTPTPYISLYIFIPLIFSLSYRFFSQKEFSRRTLAFLGVIFFFSNIAFSNAAFYISLNIFIVCLITIIYFFHKKSFKEHAKRAFWFYALFVASTAASVFPQLPGLFSLSRKFTDGNAYFNLNEWIYWQAFDIKNLFLWLDNISYFTEKYSPAILFPAVLFIIMSIIPLGWGKHGFRNKKIVITFSLMMVICLFLLNKGKGFMSRELIIAVFGSNPILSSLRSIDKTLIFLPFLMLANISVLLLSIENKKKAAIFNIILAISIVPLFPILNGKLLTHYQGVENNYESSEYSYIVKIPEEYYRASNGHLNQKLDYRFMNIPYSVMNSIGWINYPKWKAMGCDPTIQLFSQPIVQMNAPESVMKWNYGEAWNKGDNEGSEWILPLAGMMNVRYFIYHKDINQNFIRATSDKIERYLSEGLIKKVEENEYFDIYKLDDKFFLPRIYAANRISISGTGTERLAAILSNKDYDVKSTIFLKKNNDGFSDRLSEINKNDPSVPMLEYKKINPVKYRVRVHGASGQFLMVLSEEFSSGWKLYLSDRPFYSTDSENLGVYETLRFNRESQASLQEIAEFVNQGWVTDLGNLKDKKIKTRYWKDREMVDGKEENRKIDFVSKNYHGTIQNDNLPSGQAWETWFSRPIGGTASHSIFNTYANGWIVDPGVFCADSNYCIANEDGTYDFEIVMDFWPQRLIYLGWFFSIAAFLLCFFCLMIKCRIVRRKKPVLT